MKTRQDPCERESVWLSSAMDRRISHILKQRPPHDTEPGRLHAAADGGNGMARCRHRVAQMAAEVTGITEDKVNVLSTQDTDVSPFDTGAYASRQTYVSGMAVKKPVLYLRKDTGLRCLYAGEAPGYPGWG